MGCWERTCSFRLRTETGQIKHGQDFCTAQFSDRLSKSDLFTRTFPIVNPDVCAYDTIRTFWD